MMLGFPSSQQLIKNDTGEMAGEEAAGTSESIFNHFQIWYEPSQVMFFQLINGIDFM